MPPANSPALSSEPPFRNRFEETARRLQNDPKYAAARAARCLRDDERARKNAIGANLMHLSGQLGDAYSRKLASVDTFILRPEPNIRAVQAEVLSRIRAITAHVAEFVSNCRGLILYGPVGTGKDHLLAAVLYAAGFAGKRCGWINAAKFYADVSDRYTTGWSEEVIMQPLAAYDVLGISDPIAPTAEVRGTDVGKLCNLLDRRARHGLPTWATLNALSPDDAEEKLTPPVFDRLRHKAEIIRCFWPSWRESPVVRPQSVKQESSA